MSQERKNQLSKLKAWFIDGLSDESLATIAKISGFKYLTFEDKRKTVLYIELGYFYIFFIILYLKNNLPDLSFDERNYLLNSIHKNYFSFIDRNSWFESLNKKLKKYGEAWDSPKAGKMFGVVGLLMIDLYLENKPQLPGYFETINLTEFFSSYFKKVFS